ncbi:MAG TPA: MarR family transcriptional regulator [Rhodothermales bacterium]
MATQLKDELRQRKPFESLQHEAQLSILRTAAMMMDGVEQVLRPHGITATQFNVLRILRGAEPDGLCRNEIRDRMLNRMPDVTRLLDRMEEAGLIQRSRSDPDRRVVRTRITEAGSAILDAVDADVRAQHERPFVDLDEKEVRTLIRLLASIRDRL